MNVEDPWSLIIGLAVLALLIGAWLQRGPRDD